MPSNTCFGKFKKMHSNMKDVRNVDVSVSLNDVTQFFVFYLRNNTLQDGIQFNYKFSGMIICDTPVFSTYFSLTQFITGPSCSRALMPSCRREVTTGSPCMHTTSCTIRTSLACQGTVLSYSTLLFKRSKGI